MEHKTIYPKLLMPISSFIEWFHHVSGVPELIYQPQKYFIGPIHSTIWLRLSLIFTFFTAYAMSSPTLYALLHAKNICSSEASHTCTLFETLSSLPPGSNVKLFFLVQSFCLLHLIFVFIGLASKQPLFFFPSQLALLIFIANYIISSMNNLWDVTKDCMSYLERLGRPNFQVYRYDTDEEYGALDSEIVPIVYAIINLLVVLLAIFLEYVIETSKDFIISIKPEVSPIDVTHLITPSYAKLKKINESNSNCYLYDNVPF